MILTSGHGPLFEATRGSAVRALLQAQPYSMLSLTTYDQWKEIDIDFDPREVFGGGSPFRVKKSPDRYAAGGVREAATAVLEAEDFQNESYRVS